MVDFARTRATLSQLQKAEALTLEDTLGLFCDLCEDISDEENPPLFTLPVQDNIRLMEVLAPSCRQLLNIFTIKAKDVEGADPSGMLENFRSQLDVKSADLRKKEAQWRIDSRELKQTRRELEAQLTDYQARVAVLAQERQEAEAIRTKCEVLRGEIRRLEEISLEEARRERAELETKKRAVLKQIGGLHDESDALTAQITEAEKELQKRLAGKESLRRLLSERNRQIEETIEACSALNAKAEELLEKLRQLQQKNEELEQRTRELQEVLIPERIARRDELRGKLEPLEEKKRELETEIAGYQQILAAKTREVETLVAKGEALKAELQKAETEKIALEEAIRDLNVRHRELEKKLASYQDTERKQKQQNEALAQEIAAIRDKTLPELSARKEDLTDERDGLQKQVTRLTEDIKVLDKAIEELKKDLERQKIINGQREKRNEELIDELRRLRLELEHIEKMHTSFVEDYYRTREDIKEKQRRCSEESRKKKEALEQEKRELAEEKKRLDEGNEALNSQVSQLRDNLKALTSIQKKLDQLQVIHDAMIEDCGFLLTTKPEGAQGQIRDMCECLGDGLFQAKKNLDAYTKRFKEIQNLFSGGSNS